MHSIYFNDRKGQTVLSHGEKKGLRLKHITNMSELDEAEQININKGLMWLGQQKKKDFLHETFMKSLHKKLFGEVWKWAGVYRLSEKNIGIESWKITSEVKKLCENTKYWLEHDSYTWPELLAHFHHRLVYIHPFPNGNGRFSRIFTDYLCEMNNHPAPSWHREESPKERRHRYIAALQDGDMKKYQKLIEFFS